MENRLFAYFDTNPSKAYPVLYGATYTETFNEEINSMNIILDGVSSDDRLYFDRPYHFVKIVNDIPENEEGLLFNGNNYIFMLVDTWSESLNSLGEEKIYRYEIQLMNCVKLLEKIQCPNLVITHSLVEGQETIWDYIDKYMEQYSPKIKISSEGEVWRYDYLLKWKHLANDERFQVVCADMQMSEPTLRQLITNLMLQVGCIPTINYRTLGYIDFREEQSKVSVDDSDGINFISHSVASDSYANNIVKSPTQVLDDKNTVIADVVGFRDSNNAVIKQTENLQLEVRYPIYKIKQVLMRTTANSQGYLVPTNEDNDRQNSYYPILWDTSNNHYNSFSSGDTGTVRQWRLLLNFTFTYQGIPLKSGKLSGLRIHLMNYDEDLDKYTEVKLLDYVLTEWNISVPETLSSSIGYNLNVDGTVERNDGVAVSLTNSCNLRFRTNQFNFGDRDAVLTNHITHVWVENTYEMENSETLRQFIPLSPIKSSGGVYYVNFKTTPFINNSEYSLTYYYPSNETPMEYLNIPANTGKYIDVSDIFIENGKRRLLNVDYNDMRQTLFDNITDERKKETTLENLAEYIYGTFGYSIGDNKITGMSNTYSRAQMWWTVNQTYFDTILEFIQARPWLIIFDYGEFERYSSQAISDYETQYGMPIREANFKVIFSTNLQTFEKSKFLFDIYYQPLNNFKNELSKEDKESIFNIEQLDSNADGLSDYFRLMLNAQDTVNRIGNTVKVIPQTTDNLSKIKPLNGIYDDGFYKYTIFNRQFSIYENYLSVKYTASENYVIKNYFTSIITKYRAYEYVDYNQAIVRKDINKIYCLISDKHYYDGDDHLIIFNQTYSLSDLASILDVDVSELEPGGSIINYDDSNTNTIDYINRFDIYYSNSIRYYVFVYFPVPSDMGYDYKSGLITDLREIKTTTEVLSAYSSLSEEYQTKSFVWLVNNFWGTVTFGAYNAVYPLTISDYVEQELRLQSENYINFVQDKFYSQDFYLVNSQMQLLDKMNGGILKEGNNYYRINITYLNDDFVPDDLATNIRLDNSEYSVIRNIFVEADRKFKAAINARATASFGNSALFSLKAARKSISIYLELLDNYSQAKNEIIFISGLTTNVFMASYPIKYVIKRSYNSVGNTEETKNECSVLSSKNGFSFYYQDYDNVSAGPYLTNLTPVGLTTGLVQKWQVWNQDLYGKSHEISFAYQLNLKPADNESTIDSYVRELPIINRGWTYKEFTIFQIVDDNKNQKFDFTFNKDVGEIINQTIQFEYYNDTNDIKWTRFFIDNNQLLNRLPLAEESTYKENENGNTYLVLKHSLITIWDEYNLKENMYQIKVGEYTGKIFGGYVDIYYDSDVGLPCIEVDWGDILEELSDEPYIPEQFKLTFARQTNQSGLKYTECYDIMSFRRNGRTTNTKYYLSLNDTKSSDVWYFSDDESLPETYECDNGTSRTCHLKNN